MDDLLYYGLSVFLAWSCAITVFIVWHSHQVENLKDVNARQDDRITHVYDELAKLETKVNVKAQVQEAIEEAII